MAGGAPGATVDVLAFGAHPDDVELTVGGTMIKMADLGYRTGVVDLTRGERGTRGDPETRAREAAEAAKAMNLSVRRNLSMPDGGLYVTEERVASVVEVLRELRPSLVIAPHWEGHHPDHAECCHLVRRATFLAGMKKFEAPGEPHRPDRTLYAMYRLEFRPSFVVDVTDQFDRRLEAIRAYRSQVADPGAPDATNTDIGREDFLDGIITRAKYYGNLIGARYGEPFLTMELMEVEDPVKTFRAFRGIRGRGFAP